jgi:hypothetical protein
LAEDGISGNIYPWTCSCRRKSPSFKVAALVSYVASPVSSATNGAALRVDGGVIKTAY